MNIARAALAALALALTPLAAEDAPKDPDPKEAPAKPAPPAGEVRTKGSYALGQMLGKDFSVQGFDMDMESFLKGLHDGLAGKGQLTDEQMRENFMAFQEGMAKAAADKNKKDGETFLAENGKKDGIVTLPSGLQYKVIKEGAGEKPLASDSVSAAYKGTFVNGTVFDSNENASFPVKGVIKGWQEALQLMKVGSKWQVFIPPQLGYGVEGFENAIPPNSTLIFEMELLALEKGQEKGLLEQLLKK